MLKETVARLAKEQIAPGAEKRDKEAVFPWDMVDVLGENCLSGTDFPEKYRGLEMGLLGFCLVIEEIAKLCASTSVILTTQELGAMPYFSRAVKSRKTGFSPHWPVEKSWWRSG
jgi:alkylation response protein AidB-like acyl-CoA dehydrogenase